MSQAAKDSAEIRSYSYKRHSLSVRLMHWVNASCLLILLLSGLQIFNAHPALYWGKSSYTGRAPLLQMRAEDQPDGSMIGVTEILGYRFHTTGLFGVSKDSSGEAAARGFPSWLTIPSTPWLALGRRWHFFFAWIFVINGAIYVAYSLISRHLEKSLLPTKIDWASTGRSILDHLRFRHPSGEEAKHYNILQKLTYIAVMFGLLPLMVLMGLAMSPRMDSLFAGWIDLFGGRQSARTIHFLAASLIVLFFLVHVFEVMISGAWNNLRSMITGRYAVQSSVPAEDIHVNRPQGDPRP